MTTTTITTTLHLMHALRWQGGTVHQVASATGLKVDTILNLKDTKITDLYELEMYNNGVEWMQGGGGESNIPKVEKGNVFFWLGVLAWQENKK